MTMVSAIVSARCEARLEELRAEFGGIMSERIIEAEAADFLWEARLKERYLGEHIDVGFGLDDDERELVRVAVLSVLGGRWHAAACLVDGDGAAVDLLWKKEFENREEAETAFGRAV